MDRPGWAENTDNIVVADSGRLMWVPRDMWVETLGMRVNGAYAEGGADGLLSALRELGVRAHHVLCAQREVTEAALADVAVEVAVREPLRFWYPRAPQAPIEEGRKEVSFHPPSERLSGERVHQWLGARISVDDPLSGDLERIARQQVFVAALLSQGFSATGLLRDRPDLFRVSDERALAELARVGPEWPMTVMGPLTEATIKGCHVLVPQGTRKPRRLRTGLRRRPRSSVR